MSRFAWDFGEWKEASWQLGDYTCVNNTQGQKFSNQEKIEKLRPTLQSIIGQFPYGNKKDTIIHILGSGLGFNQNTSVYDKLGMLAVIASEFSYQQQWDILSKAINNQYTSIEFNFPLSLPYKHNPNIDYHIDYNAYSDSDKKDFLGNILFYHLITQTYNHTIPLCDVNENIKNSIHQYKGDVYQELSTICAQLATMKTLGYSENTKNAYQEYAAIPYVWSAKQYNDSRNYISIVTTSGIPIFFFNTQRDGFWGMPNLIKIIMLQEFGMFLHKYLNEVYKTMTPADIAKAKANIQKTLPNFRAIYNIKENHAEYEKQ